MRAMVADSNVMFFKSGCPFCEAAETLAKELVSREIISSYKVLLLDQDFSNQDLTDLVREFGWEPLYNQEFCTKPQIFILGQYIGGNREFYQSRWNTGDQEGMVYLPQVVVDPQAPQTESTAKPAPKLTNPMRF